MPALARDSGDGGAAPEDGVAVVVHVGEGIAVEGAKKLGALDELKPRMVHSKLCFSFGGAIV